MAKNEGYFMGENILTLPGKTTRQIRGKTHNDMSLK